MAEQRLIDANAFDNRVRVAFGFAEEEMSDDFKDGVLAVLEMLKRQPTIEERKTGKWVPVDSYSAFGGDEVMWEIHGNPIAFYYCSECKEHAYAGEDGESLLTTYCPHCGARLVQEGEEP